MAVVVGSQPVGSEAEAEAEGEPDGDAVTESEVDPDAESGGPQAPADYMRAKALGGAKSVSRAQLKQAARQASAISSAGGSWEYVGANNIGGRVTDVVVDPTPCRHDLRRLRGRRRLEEHRRRA